MSASGKVQILLEVVDKASGKLSQIGSRIQGLSDIAKITGGVLGAQLGLGGLHKVTEFAKESISTFARFETSLIQLKKLGGVSAKEVQGLAKNIRKLGVDYGVGANQAAEGMTALIKAGLDATEATDALTASMTMAQLEGINVGAAGEYLVQVMTSFGLKATDATKIMESLTFAASKGISSISGYSQGLSNVAATAHGMGFSLEDTLAVLVRLDNVFGDVVSSGTFLNRLFLDMIRKSDKLGFSLYDGKGQMIDLRTVIIKLKEQVASYGDNQKLVNEYLSTFDTRAQKAIQAIIGMDADHMGLAAAMGESTLAAETLEEQLESTQGAMMRYNAAMEGFMSGLGESFGPVLTPYLEWLVDVFEYGAKNREIAKDLEQEYGRLASKLEIMAERYRINTEGLAQYTFGLEEFTRAQEGLNKTMEEAEKEKAAPSKAVDRTKEAFHLPGGELFIVSPEMQARREMVSGLAALKGIEGMQHGGIVTQPTLALLGESGPERVTPLGSPDQPLVGELQINVSTGAVEGDISAERLYETVSDVLRDELRRLGVKSR